MGTSSSYKGSSSSQWRSARDKFDEVGSTDGGSAAPGGSGATGSPADNSNNEDDDIAEIASLIADALERDDRTTTLNVSFSTRNLLPTRRGRGSGGGGSGISKTGGRQGNRSHREVTRSAARGGTAIAGAYALRNSDAEALNQIGLNLEELRNLSPLKQCERIAEAVLGDAHHPDDHALKRATLEHLKNILVGESPPSPEDSIKGFVTEWIFQLGLVELQAESKDKSLTPQQVVNTENMIKNYLQSRVNQLISLQSGNLSINRIANLTARITNEVIKLLKVRRG